MAGVVQAMPERGRRASIGKGIVPVADLVDVAPGREARPARYTDRAVAIGVLEQGPARCEVIEIRRLDDRIPVRAEYALAVLVGHDEQDVASGHSGFSVAIGFMRADR